VLYIYDISSLRVKLSCGKGKRVFRPKGSEEDKRIAGQKTDLVFGLLLFMKFGLEMSGASVLGTEWWGWLDRGWPGKRASMATEFKGEKPIF